MDHGGGGFVSSQQELPQPAQARSPAEFIEALRTLRIRSGLSYRHLEAKAAAHGDSLPTSTTASALGRSTLPRERFVEVFTRACGLTDEETDEWLEVRGRIATHWAVPVEQKTHDDRDIPVPITDTSVAVRARRSRYAAGLLGAALLGDASALGVISQSQDASAPADLPATPVNGLRMLAVGSWVRIHPARTPERCLTEGRDRTGRYPTAVAVQRSCTAAGLPEVYLEPVGKDTVQIQWHHPKYGIGCLTVLSKGSARNLLEPRDDCADSNRAQQFRVDHVGSRASARFLIRPVSTGQCLSLRDQDTEEGTEVVQGRCSGASDQDFLIDLVPPPRTAAAPSGSGAN
ncbi:XRE family transcriptional regulator [Streptomyces griseus]|uniref:RICIN domain-containing protein n=1 Tax=Streptomyces griseus TaxID=1911 RepID=UPI001C5856C3|nr:RICIN domain-containing protein [Streptomyces griseus]MBW3709262.1 XRE family transcriptional regulator [Streptomyces griseus]